MAKRQHDLQQQISSCELRVKIYTKILHEDEIMFSSFEHEIFCLDGVIESSEERQHFALTRRQVCEINNVEFQVIQIANTELKNIEDKHKDLLKETIATCLNQLIVGGD
jgi:hypothetical protein